MLLKTNMALCFSLFIHFFSLGQNKDTLIITPGNNSLNTDKLKNYKIKYDFFSYKEGVENKIGELEDEFITMPNSGEKLGLRVCNITFGANKILDSGLFVLDGLKPIYHRSMQTKKRIALDFNNELVTGKILFFTEKGDSSEVINYISKTALFDSYYEDLIAKTIRFKKGLVFKFPEYIYERGGLVWSGGQVADKLKISNKNGNTDVAWKILFFENDHDGNIVRTTTYLVNADNREIISREYKTKTGLILMKLRQE